MADQSVSDIIDKVIKEDIWIVLDAPSGSLRNHQIGCLEDNRKIYITADIHPEDLDPQKNATPTEDLCKWIQESGYECDYPGLIVPSEFGGYAGPYNLFPQSKFMDTTTLDNDKEEVRNYLAESQPDRHAQLEFVLEYTKGSGRYKRPFYVYYRFSLYDKDKVVKKLCNKLTNTIRQ